MPNHNLERLSEDIKREISTAMREVKSISEKIVTVTRCELTGDLSYCKVYVSCLGGEEKTLEAINALSAASGFLKRRINSRIKMRKIPELIFKADTALDYYNKISSIIDTFPKRDEDNETNDN